MLNRIKSLVFCLLALVISSNVYSNDTVVNWTGRISNMTVLESEVSYIFLNNLTSPSPASNWSCTSNIVYLKSKTEAAGNKFYSHALTAYTLDKTIRIGVKGSGSSCVATYITYL